MLYRSINKTTHFKPNNLFFKTFSLMSIIHLYTVYAQGKNKLTVVDFYKNINIKIKILNIKNVGTWKCNAWFQIYLT